jgi:TolB-like protein/DNA-binding SARP family transcriptional activator
VNRLKLFGGVALDAESGPITGRAAQRHRVALLALLSTTTRLHRSRDQLITFLWPEANPERGRKLLSDSIYRINQALGGDAVLGSGEDVRLNRSQLHTDVADVEAAMDVRDWRRVAELYAGPFLDGFFLPDAPEFDQWMEAERARYVRAACRAIEALAVAARDAGRVADALEWWQRLSALVPDDSRVAMELMRALEASGNRAGALRHARLHSHLLREQFDLEPDPFVQRLATQIAKRSDPLASASSGVAPDTVPTAPFVETGPVRCNSIAVLPFHDLTYSDANARLAAGVSEELMFILTRTPGLHVASRTSAIAYRSRHLDVREVARRLRVAWILEGSVRQSGSVLRFAAQLTDASNGYQVWSDSFDQATTDTSWTEADVAGAIVSRLALAMNGRFAVHRGMLTRERTAGNCADHSTETSSFDDDRQVVAPVVHAVAHAEIQ